MFLEQEAQSKQLKLSDHNQRSKLQCVIHYSTTTVIVNQIFPANTTTQQLTP